MVHQEVQAMQMLYNSDSFAVLQIEFGVPG